MLLLIASIECREDRDLMTQFYEKNLKLLLHEARKHIFIEEDVQDIVYEAFVKIIEKIDIVRDLKPQQQLKYGIVTVRNLCYLHIRKEKRFPTVSFEEITEDIPTLQASPEEITERSMMHEQIHTIISKLELEERLLLEQKYILRWNDIEMAQLYGIKAQSMRMKLTRAKRALVTLMREHNFPPVNWEI